MDQTISANELIEIVRNSGLDQTIKDIIIRDIGNDASGSYLLDQVAEYFEETAQKLKQSTDQKPQDPAP